MVIIENLPVEAVSIVIQHPLTLNPFYPVVKDEFQFRPLNFTQKFLNASEKIGEARRDVLNEREDQVTARARMECNDGMF
jgi:hypothetical protein